MSAPKLPAAVYVTVGAKDGRPRFHTFARGRLWPCKAAAAEQAMAAGATVYRKRAGESIWSENQPVVVDGPDDPSAAPPAPAVARSAHWLDACARVVERHQHERVDGFLLDAQTANVLQKVDAALSPANRERLRGLPLDRAAGIAWRLVG